jgi:BMFP domain-containing protein YqiC
MNPMIFTVEEENLICVYDISSRAALMHSIRGATADFDEPELNEIAENVLNKLDNMTDEEFSAFILCPAYYDERSV